MSDRTRHSLIDAIKSTNSEERGRGWEQLWTVYKDYVRYLVRRAGAKEGDVDDIAQDVFDCVARNIDKFNLGDRAGSFRTWLKKIAYHRVTDYYRSQAKCVGAGEGSGRTDAFGYVPVREQEADEDEGELAEVRKTYERALQLARSEFSEATVTMFRKAVVDGRPTGDIADEHDVSQAAVRMAKSRVLRRLRELLGETEG